MYEFKGVRLHWLGHSGFFIESLKNVCIDPFKIEKNFKADLILITHSHYDHCSVADIETIITENTTIICSPDCLSKLNHLKVKNIQVLEPGQSTNIEGIMVETVPAYNTNKQFHPKADNWLGFIVTIDGIKIYHAGDTDLIDEMAQIKCDIALLPVSGTYVMTSNEAAEALKHLQTKVAIPMHYGSIVGTVEDAQDFKAKAGCEVIILEKE